MRYLEGFYSGWLVLKANKLRSFLTMLGIIIGTGGVIGTISFGEGARQLVLGEVDKIGGTSTFNVQRVDWIRQDDGRWVPNPSREFLTLEDMERIQRFCPSVETVTPEMARGAHLEAIGGAKRSQILATGPEYRLIRNWMAEIGRFLEDTDLSFWSKVAVIGAEVAKDLFGTVDPIGQEIRINNQRFTVVGVMESKGGGDSPGGSLDNQVYLPVTTALATFWGNNRVQGFVLKAKSPELVRRAMQEVEVVLRRYHNDEKFFEVYSQALDMQRDANVIGAAIKTVLGVIAGLALVVGGVGILNIMLVSVAERTHEIGIRKAVGATRRDIAVQFLLEAVLLCLVGSLLGLLTGWLTERALAHAVIRYIMHGGSWPSLFSWKAVLLAVGAGSATGIAAGLFPALRAAQLPPTEALRTV